MLDKKLTDSEIVKAKELIKKLGEAYDNYYDSSKGMPYDIDTTLLHSAICFKNCLNELNRLQAELETLRAYIHDNGLEWDLLSYYKRNEKLKGIKTNDWLIKGISAEQLEQEKIQAWKAEAYKKCIEKVKEISKYETYCDNRLPAPIITYHITEDKLDNLLKELVGD